MATIRSLLHATTIESDHQVIQAREKCDDTFLNRSNRVTWAHPEFGGIIVTVSYDRFVNIWDEVSLAGEFR